MARRRHAPTHAASRSTHHRLSTGHHRVSTGHHHVSTGRHHSGHQSSGSHRHARTPATIAGRVSAALDTIARPLLDRPGQIPAPTGHVRQVRLGTAASPWAALLGHHGKALKPPKVHLPKGVLVYGDFVRIYGMTPLEYRALHGELPPGWILEASGAAIYDPPTPAPKAHAPKGRSSPAGIQSSAYKPPAVPPLSPATIRHIHTTGARPALRITRDTHPQVTGPDRTPPNGHGPDTTPAPLSHG